MQFTIFNLAAIESHFTKANKSLKRSLNFNLAPDKLVAVVDEVPGPVPPLRRLLPLQGAVDGHVHGGEGLRQGNHGHAH